MPTQTSSTGTAPRKICIRCGTNVANAPRVRDQQGRYVCQPCYDHASSNKQAPTRTANTPPASETEELLIVPTESAALQSTPCPHCNQPTPADAIVCFNCGYNKQTGRREKTKTLKERPARAAKPQTKGTPTRADLATIAAGQRWMLALFLLNILFGAVSGATNSIANQSPGQINPSTLLAINIASIAVGLCIVAGVVYLANALGKHAGKVVLYGFMALIPIISLLAILRLNAQATKQLKQAGYKIGLMGAKNI